VTPDRDGDHRRDDLLAALREPIRRRLLFLLNDRPQGATIGQLAKKLAEPPRRIRHYVEILVEAGQVVVEDERYRRNTIERSYRSAQVPLLWHEDWPADLGLADTRMVLLAVLRLTFDSVSEAIATGTFAGREGWCVARTWREVDAQGWKELAEIHEGALLEVVAAVDRAEERLAGDEAAESIPAISALFLMPALPWET
jgi:DNA-binding transcriptional ArsR family regulator